jgi:hypothetical protein
MQVTQIDYAAAQKIRSLPTVKATYSTTFPSSLPDDCKLIIVADVFSSSYYTPGGETVLDTPRSTFRAVYIFREVSPA